MRQQSRLLSAVAALTLAATGLQAQQPQGSIRGVVSDGSRPLEQASVEIFGTKLKATTAANGAFAFDSLKAGPYWLRVRRIGFAPVTFSMTLMSGQQRDLQVHLEATPYELPELQVSGGMTRYKFAEFDWRRKAAWGRFYTRDDIARVRPTDPIDLALRALPGRSRFDLEERFTGMAQFVSVTMPDGQRLNAKPNRLSGICAPAISVNGSVPFPGNNLRDFQLEDVEAMEVYRNNRHAPMEFQSYLRDACGVVVVWLR